MGGLEVLGLLATIDGLPMAMHPPSQSLTPDDSAVDRPS